MVRNWNILFGIAIFFFALTLAVYGTSLTNDFVRWDDGLLIYENPAVREITSGSLGWIFSHFDPELYIPLTFFSYQIDYLIAGTSPFMFHLTNLILHTLNSILVAGFVWLLLRRKWVALFCGLLFAIHPLHTEAVAWASARKDVLSGFFFLGALVSYLLWMRRNPESGIRNPGEAKDNSGFRVPNSGFRKRQTKTCFLSLTFFLLALLSKVSVILLPLILILIDYLQGKSLREKGLWISKIPYVVLSVIFGIIAIVGKKSVISETSLVETFLMACRSTVFYMQKLFIPTDLSVLYPTSSELSITNPEYLIPLLVIISIVGILYFFRHQKLLVFGALFFFMMLLPNFTNFAKDGDFYFASDRYAYLASIGIILIFCNLMIKVPSSKLQAPKNYQLSIFNYQLVARVALISLIVMVFGVMANTQAKAWKDTESLFLNVIENYPNSHRARNNLGNIYRRRGELDDAIVEFEKAIAISPRPRTYSNLGAVYRKKGMMLEAINQYRTAMEINPDDPEPHFGLGIVYAERGDFQNAKSSYERAIELDPFYAEAMGNLGALYAAVGEYKKAITEYRRAIEADTLFTEAYFNMGVALTKVGRVEEAIKAYEAAVKLRSDIVAVRINLGLLYYNVGRVGDAKDQFEEILEIDPGNRAAESALQQIK